MPDPAGLLAVARLLLDESFGPVSESQLRRAASTAYYALFHKVLRTAADRFAGTGAEAEAAYGIIYRSLDHGRIKDVCGKLNPAVLSETMRRQLRGITISQDMRDFASSFSAVQDIRHLADYDPIATFEKTETIELIRTVETAIAAFDRTGPAERAAVLALMLGRPRA